MTHEADKTIPWDCCLSMFCRTCRACSSRSIICCRRSGREQSSRRFQAGATCHHTGRDTYERGFILLTNSQRLWMVIMIVTSAVVCMKSVMKNPASWMFSTESLRREGRRDLSTFLRAARGAAEADLGAANEEVTYSPP